MSDLLSHFFKAHSSSHSFLTKKAPTIQDIQNIAFILGVKKLDQSHLNLKFLQEHNIIDSDWQLLPNSTKRSANSPVIQLNFENGVTLMGLPQSLIIRERVRNSQVSNLASPTIIKRYTNYFQKTVYQSLTVNLQRIFNLPNQQTFLENYTKDNLLNQSIFFQNFYPLLQADISYQYQLERCQLNFRTKVGHLQPKLDKGIPFILFLGGFKYKIYNFQAQERLQKIEQSLAYLEQDYNVFQELVEQRFLG